MADPDAVPEVNPFLAEPDSVDSASVDPVASVAALIPTSVSSTLGEFFKTLILYIPNAVVLFGFIVDAINQDFRYSIASIIGILSVFVNFAVSFPLKMVFPVSKGGSKMRGGFVGCTVPGFESIESQFSPQGIVLPTAIFMYLIMDFAMKRSASANIGIGVIFPAFLLIQYSVMRSSGCFDKYYWSDSFLTVLSAFIVGSVFGVSAWGIVKTFFPSSLPSSAGAPPPAPPPPTTPSGTLGPILPPSGSSNPNVGTCSAPNDQDQFVCDAYKNGQKITSTLVE
jgi:hypothetical protein